MVPGDVVLLASGAKRPSDLRLLKTYESKVEETMLTGESIPAVKIDMWIRRRKKV